MNEINECFIVLLQLGALSLYCPLRIFIPSVCL